MSDPRPRDGITLPRGGGEWLVGPAAAVKYTASIFLIVTVAIALQILAT